MPKINSAQKLAVLIGGLIIAFINVISYYKEEAMTVIAGSTIANQVNPAIEWIGQWTVVITIIIIIILIILAVVNYLVNRRKPDKPSPEAEAVITILRDIHEDLKGLKEDLRGGRKDGQQ